MASLTARDWTMAAARRLASHGVENVKVEPLAAGLGVSKGSFYWHFTDREALLRAILELWETAGTEAIIADVEAHNIQPVERVKALMARTFGEPQHDAIELGIRAWARHDELARAVAERVDERRVAYVADLLTASGVPAPTARLRAEFMYRTLIGEFVLRAQGRTPLSPATLDALAASLVAPE